MMTETLGSSLISTKLEQIAKLAKEMPGVGLTTLAHHVDVEWLREAYRRTRKSGALGVDGESALQYAKRLEENLYSLLERAKSGTYRAPPVRRVHIPKGDGTKTRPIGIPTFEDKVLQRAVAMVVEAVYETSFLDVSYGFRPGRSALQACEAFQKAAWQMGGGWVLEVDIAKFFDTLDHEHLRQILHRRIRDGVLLRLIGKWLNAGVLEEGSLSYPEEGTPQGGVISPLLANIYLHEVLDEWFIREVVPRLRGRAVLVRYADDFVMLFEQKYDAQRVFDVLPKRFGKYGLTLHPDKTRLVAFRRPDRAALRGEEKPGTFDLLGFTHHWGLSRKGKWIVKRRTAKDRISRTLRRFREWCRAHRHAPVVVQHLALVRKLNGHYAYYGITSNYDAIARVWHEVKAIWRVWLSKRSRKAFLSWAAMHRLLARFPLPTPRIVHRYGT
jgi:group II intron reverse transcriptase/maturase